MHRCCFFPVCKIAVIKEFSTHRSPNDPATTRHNWQIAWIICTSTKDTRVNPHQNNQMYSTMGITCKYNILYSVWGGRKKGSDCNMQPWILYLNRWADNHLIDILVSWLTCRNISSIFDWWLTDTLCLSKGPVYLASV